MNFNNHFTTTLEIDPNEINDEIGFLQQTKAEPDENGYIYLDVEVEYSGHYESASCFGTWEDSLPDEFSLEIDGIYFHEGSQSLDVARFFREELMEKVRELAEKDWSNY